MALRPATPVRVTSPPTRQCLRSCLRSSIGAFTGAGPSRVSHTCRTLCRTLATNELHAAAFATAATRHLVALGGIEPPITELPFDGPP